MTTQLSRSNRCSSRTRRSSVLYGSLAALRDVRKNLLRHVIPTRPRRQQRDVHWLELKSGLVGVCGEVGFGCLQPILVVAVREIRFVVCAARLVAHGGALCDYARELKHVVELPREGERGVGPHALIAPIDVAETFEQ